MIHFHLPYYQIGQLKRTCSETPKFYTPLAVLQKGKALGLPRVEVQRYLPSPSVSVHGKCPVAGGNRLPELSGWVLCVVSTAQVIPL